MAGTSSKNLSQTGTEEKEIENRTDGSFDPQNNLGKQEGCSQMNKQEPGNEALTQGTPTIKKIVSQEVLK